jgi:hypothetical protein
MAKAMHKEKKSKAQGETFIVLKPDSAKRVDPRPNLHRDPKKNIRNFFFDISAKP